MEDSDPERTLTRLLGEAQALSRLGPAAERAARPGEVTDPTGAVTVRLEPDGRVTSVTVAADWRDRIPAVALGATVRDLVVAWQLRPVRALTDAAADPGPVLPVRPPLAPPLREPSWDELTAMLGTVQRALSLLPELTAAAAAPPPADVGYSANRLVAVILAAGQVADVTVDEAWAGRANRQPLSDAFAEAFADAYDRPPADAADPRLAGVTQDLQDIVRWLGLPRAPAAPASPGGAR